MYLEDFEKMSLTEIQKFQEDNKKKIERNRKRALKKKKETHTLIKRGKIVNDMVPDSENMDDEQFFNALYNLIYNNK